ncbi:YraN family protein [Bifidobacterium sp. 82T24]|nr:YraN family protein [Bifidobacterium pluvialisilvae]MBW3087826.1 YraN family protein [Bifidobacterium pluvialisilvae]
MAGEPSAARVRQQIDQLTRRLHQPGLTPRQLGRLGEDYAELWLRERGWTILDRNWRSRHGELDVIALNRADQLTFVEVKTRRSAMFGPPQDAVTEHKRKALRHAGMEWIQRHGDAIRRSGTRFDVLAISVLGGRRAPQIRHIPGAF